MKKSEKVVVVTGANGFIGLYCLPILKNRGFEVHAFSRKNEGEADGIQWHKIDLLKEHASPLFREIRATHLLHLAWYTEHGKFWTSENNPLWIKASASLAESFFENGGQKVTMAGTCAEYEWTPSIECTEGVTPENPSTLYGRSKKESWELLSQTAKKWRGEASNGRVFYLYGPGEPITRLIPSALIALLQGQRAHCNNPENVRDFLFVQDVADALVSLLDSPVKGCVNIASGKSVKFRNLMEEIKTLAPGPVDFGPPSPTSNEPCILTASVKRLREEVGWSPRVSLEQGLGLTLEWIHSILDIRK